MAESVFPPRIADVAGAVADHGLTSGGFLSSRMRMGL
jgi:hypothetical protein